MSGSRWTAWLAHALAIVCLAGIAGTFWLPGAGDAFDSWSTASRHVARLIFLLVALFVGWFLAWRRRRTALGWLTLAIPVLFLVTVPLILLGFALIPTHPTAAAWLLLVGGGNGNDGMHWVPPVGLLLSQIPLRFPTGSLPSRRWRWFSRYTIAAIVTATVLGSTVAPEVGYGVLNPVHVAWGDAENAVLFVVFGLCLLPTFVGSIASLFVRYHGAGTLARAQLRWMFWGAAGAAAWLVLGWIASFFMPGFVFGIGAALALLGYCLIPVAILIAVMRFGLYGIDRIISRSVSYATVVVAVVALYAAVVTGLTALIPNLPSIGAALATLAAAAVFLPLLRWVQRWVDRRFDRAAYDAQKVVEAFGRRLRDGAHPHTAAADLLAALEQTLQPTALGVWTR